MKTAGVKRICFLVVPAVLLLLWFACRPVDYLLVTTIKNEQTLLALPLTHGPDFSIGYIHSVDIKPIFEVFTIKPGPGDRRDIYIVETYFKMFGAGMGHWAGHGRLIRKDGWTWIKDINKNLKEFILRIGSPGCGPHHLLQRPENQPVRIGAGPGSAVPGDFSQSVTGGYGLLA